MADHVTPVRMLSITMPVYNEQAVIEQVVMDHVEAAGRLGNAVPEWEIVCVDDGSEDRTPEILRELEKRVPQLRVVRQENQGIFGAITRGYREARGSHIFATGSDGQWPAANLELLLEPALAGADLVIGVRSNRREVYTPARRVISTAYNMLPRILFGVRVEDAGSNKLGVREVFEYPLISRSVFFEAERIIVAQRNGRRVEFVPIRFLARTEGKAMGASWKNLRNSMVDLLRCLGKYGFR
ncbi:MAG TPA: glycosyltransferase family 2 protein [Bryobacteraceae bacterium]|jgi:glycosyltransferase involved in cell wall biosynthesis|nr:glycosyltransferase family 2 protein [Bryobacteraceae bacterium]